MCIDKNSNINYCDLELTKAHSHEQEIRISIWDNNIQRGFSNSMPMDYDNIYQLYGLQQHLSTLTTHTNNTHKPHQSKQDISQKQIHKPKTT